MIKCEIIGKNNSTIYDVAEGAVFTENYNETLDSATIIIPHLESEIDIEPFDVVHCWSNNLQEKFMCVDTWVCTQTSLDPAIYQYEITLFSLTKLLEGILLPSLSITKLKSGNYRTIQYYLNQYVSKYGTKLDANGTYGLTNNLFLLSTRILNKFSSVECPEMQWNEPTLREVLTDLMMVKDCIPVVHYIEEDGKMEIDYIDISEVKSEISESQRKGINYIRKSQSSADYVSELKTKLVNSVGEGETTKICENITWRNYSNYIINTENLQVETSLPIWKLKSLKMVQRIYYQIKFENKNAPGTLVSINEFNYNVEKDLLPYTLEYKEWQTKDILYEPYADWTNKEPSPNYQNTSLYYSIGAKGIFNFNAKQDIRQLFWIKSQVSVYELIANSKTLNQTEEVEEIAWQMFANQYPEYDPDDYIIKWSSSTINPVDYSFSTFEVEYESLGEHMFLATKSPFVRNKRQVIDNQAQSYINIKNQGMLEYFKANRLGNKVKLINARYNTSEPNIPMLAQTIDGSIIFRKEMSVYGNFLKVNYQATDNYVLRDYFTGIKSKLRSWSIVSGNEAFTRAENFKFYVNENIDSIDSNYVLPVYDTLQQYLDNFNYCVISFNTLEGDKPNGMIYYDYEGDAHDLDIDAYMLEFQKAICGKSAIFTIKMYDNTIVGKYVNSPRYRITDSPVTYGMTQKDCPYTDSNGEIIGGVIYFYKNFSVGVYGSDNQQAYSNLLPGVSIENEMSNLVCKIPFTLHKDNKEILQITVQFEMNDEANDIFLGKK